MQWRLKSEADGNPQAAGEGEKGAWLILNSRVVPMQCCTLGFHILCISFCVRVVFITRCCACNFIVAALAYAFALTLFHFEGMLSHSEILFFAAVPGTNMGKNLLSSTSNFVSDLLTLTVVIELQQKKLYAKKTRKCVGIHKSSEKWEWEVAITGADEKKHD